MSRGWRRAGLILLMAVALVLAIFLVKIQVSPWYVGMGDDSGLFAYAGKLISEGGLLYQDIWDTKPPGVFYLNALAISLGGSTPWSIWWFELIWFSLTMIVLMVILIRITSLLLERRSFPIVGKAAQVGFELRPIPIEAVGAREEDVVVL